MTFSFLIPADDNGAVTVKVCLWEQAREAHPYGGFRVNAIGDIPWIVVAMEYRGTLCRSEQLYLPTHPHI